MVQPFRNHRVPGLDLWREWEGRRLWWSKASRGCHPGPMADTPGQVESREPFPKLGEPPMAKEASNRA